MQTTPTTFPAGLTVRPLDYDDARAVTAVMAACELHDDGQVEIDEDDIVADWQRPSFEPSRDGIGVVDGDELVAYLEVYKGRRAEGFVRPDHRGRGIGSALLRWSWERAAADGGTLVGQTVSDNNEGARALFESHGYAPLWTSWILEIGLDGDRGRPALPAGLSIRAFRPGEDDRAAYEVIENAFNEWPDREPSSFEDWAAGTVGRRGFEPWQLPLVVDGDRVVGTAYLLPYPGQGGWVHQLAVDRDYRGRGLARALLLHAFDVFGARGEQTCGLSTDSRTGALGLYEHVGMAVKRSYTHWARKL